MQFPKGINWCSWVDIAVNTFVLRYYRTSKIKYAQRDGGRRSAESTSFRAWEDKCGMSKPTRGRKPKYVVIVCLEDQSGQRNLFFLAYLGKLHIIAQQDGCKEFWGFQKTQNKQCPTV